MFSDADKNLLKELNERLTQDISQSLRESLGELKEELEGLSKDEEENTEAQKQNTKALVVLKSAMVAAGGAIANSAVSFAQKIGTQMNQFGDTLSRSAVATGRQQLVGAEKLANGMGNAEAAIDKTAGEFGISASKFAGMIDSAIRANVRDTGKQTQKFIATAAGLGNNVGSVNKFLATQTNVLGSNTQASIEFGNTILELAASNGILGDSILDAVEAFTKTTKEQSVVFGPEVSQSIQRGLTGLLTALPDLDVASLVQSLTSPEQVLKIPALAGQLGIAAPDATDPESMTRFVANAIEGLAARAGEFRGRDPKEIMPLVQALQSALGPAFNLQNIFTAQRAIEEANKKQTDILGLMTQQVDPAEAAERRKEASDAIVTASNEALQNFATFSIVVDGLNDKAKVQGEIVDKLRENIDKVSQSVGSTIGTIQGFDNALQIVNTSLYAVAGGLLSFGTGLLGATAGPGISSLRGGLSAKKVANMDKIKGSKGLSRVAKAARIGGVLTPLIAGGAEYMDTGDVSRSVAAGAGAGVGAFGGAKAGALAGSLAGPAGTLIGGIVGAIGGALGGEFLAKEVHDVVDRAASPNTPKPETASVSDTELTATVSTSQEEVVESLQEIRAAVENLTGVMAPGTPLPAPSSFPASRNKVSAGALD